MTRAGTDEFTRTPVTYPASQSFDEGGASSNAVACRSSVSGGRLAPLDQQLPQTVEDDEPLLAEPPAVHEELSDSALFLRGRTISDSASEQEEEGEEDEEEEVVVCCGPGTIKTLSTCTMK